MFLSAVSRSDEDGPLISFYIRHLMLQCEAAPTLSMFSDARVHESVMGLDRELRDIQNEFTIFTQVTFSLALHGSEL